MHLFNVYNTLGSCFLEKAYKNDLLTELYERALKAKSKVKAKTSLFVM